MNYLSEIYDYSDPYPFDNISIGFLHVTPMDNCIYFANILKFSLT